jgi:hypothetical protein
VAAAGGVLSLIICLSCEHIDSVTLECHHVHVLPSGLTATEVAVRIGCARAQLNRAPRRGTCHASAPQPLPGRRRSRPPSEVAQAASSPIGRTGSGVAGGETQVQDVAVGAGRRTVQSQVEALKSEVGVAVEREGQPVRELGRCILIQLCGDTNPRMNARSSAGASGAKLTSHSTRPVSPR